jgi:hypothetical protein
MLRHSGLVKRNTATSLPDHFDKWLDISAGRGSESAFTFLLGATLLEGDDNPERHSLGATLTSSIIWIGDASFDALLSVKPCVGSKNAAFGMVSCVGRVWN